MARSLIPPVQPDEVYDVEQLYVAMEMAMGPEKAAASPVLGIMRMTNALLERAEDDAEVKKELIRALTGAIDSMDYVNRTHPEATGSGVRVQRIRECREAIARAS